jgi:hypothetical protein
MKIERQNEFDGDFIASLTLVADTGNEQIDLENFSALLDEYTIKEINAMLVKDRQDYFDECRWRL